MLTPSLDSLMDADLGLGEQSRRRSSTAVGLQVTALGISDDSNLIALGSINSNVIVIELSDDSRLDLDHGTILSRVFWSLSNNQLVRRAQGLEP